MTNIEFEKKTKNLIDELKSVCANFGLGNDGNEFKIITQVFLYKFLNDKFIFESRIINKKLGRADDWLYEFRRLNKEELEFLLIQLNPSTARLRPEHFVATLFQKQNEPKFAEAFDTTLVEIANDNIELFSVKTFGGEKVVLFENLSKFVTDNRDDFCKAIINKLVNFSFEQVFNEKFDFFATIFEYLIKDYNTNSGGKYAEYFTPHAVAKIMASCLVQGNVQNVTCYDPSAGSGTLLMNLAHQIGEEKCTIYSQDISQKSSNLLRLNLVLNNLVHSIPNIIKGNTILEPYHKDEAGKLKKFDFIVSNPPFKLDFSDWVNDLDTPFNVDRFFAGRPKIPATKKEGMAIYPLFLQHIIYSLTPKGKAAVVVPSGFLTAQAGIEKKIREHLVDKKMLRGVISMPSNIFATTGTNVSIVFIDNENDKGDIVLIDASKLGITVKEGKNQRTVLRPDEEKLISDTFVNQSSLTDFSVVVSYEQIREKNFSFSAGQFFDVTLTYENLSPEEFEVKVDAYKRNIEKLFKKSREVEVELLKQVGKFKYD